MKFKDVCKHYQLDPEEFTAYLYSSEAVRFVPFLTRRSNSFELTNIDDLVVEDIVRCFRNKDVGKAPTSEVEINRINEEKALRAKAEMEKQRALSQMLITSGFNFDGYRIKRYSGYISGDDAMQIPRTGYFGTSNTTMNLTAALVKIRRQAIRELKEAAYDLGCNAVIGVDFDYITIDPQASGMGGIMLYEPYVICVTANGNAVVIEKTDD